MEISTADKNPRPYLGQYVDLYFGESEAAFKVPDGLLSKTSNLLPLYGTLVETPVSITLADVPQHVGHVLVHFFYTGAYQCLKPTGATSHERQIAEFTTSISVYTAARQYKIVSLEEQARSEIERLGSCLNLPTVLRVIEDVYRNPKLEDIWFIDYLKTRTKALFQDPVAVAEVCSRPSSGGDVSIAEIILESVAECQPGIWEMPISEQTV